MPFSTTLGELFANFFTHLKTTLEGASNPGSPLPIRKVAEGEGMLDEHPVPFVLVQLLSIKATGRVDLAKKWEVKLKLRVVSAITGADLALSEISNKAGQVENAIDAYVRPDGVTGFEDGEWSFTYEDNPNHGSLIIAESTRTATMIVARGVN